MYSGALWYNVHETEITTDDPIETEHELITVFSGMKPLYGNLFDVYAVYDLVVTSLDIHTDIQDMPVIVKVFTKKGSMRDNSTTWDDWREVANTKIKGNGQYGSSPIPSNAFSPVVIMADTIQSFFITLTSGNLVSTEASNYFSSSVWKADDNLKISVGAGTEEYPLALDKSTFFHNNIGWNGVLRYSLGLDTLDLSRELKYFVLINHSVDQFFSSQEYLSFVKSKWEASVENSGSIAFFDYTGILNSHGDKSEFFIT